MVHENVGRFRVRSLLGRGGMAWVYLADDPDGGPPVALKILDDMLLRDPRHRDRFRREARAAARIESPHVVAVREVGEDRGRPYIAMEFVEGETLEKLLRRTSVLPCERAFSLAADIARGLSAAHGAGVLHRDVKPSNVLIGRDGRARLTDFGIAKVASEAGMTRTGTVLGTAHYMSPEQALGETVDERSDIYSFGVLLFEMLTASVPFAGDTAVGVAMRHVTEAPPCARVLRAEIPEAVDELLRSLLAKDPAKRPAHLGRVIELLDSLTGTRTTGDSLPAVTPVQSTPHAQGSSTDTLLQVAPATPESPASGSRVPLVGREAETGLMRSLIHQALAGHGHTLFIAGEAGIGKSRLARELAALAEHRGMRVLSGPSPESDSPAPLLPFLEAIRRYFQSGAVSEHEERWRQDYLAGEGAQLLPLLGEKGDGRDDRASVMALSSRDRLFEAIVGFFEEFACRKPTLLILEDFHHADRASQDLLVFLARALARIPLMVVATVRRESIARPEDEVDFIRLLVSRGEGTLIQLERLGREELRTLLAGVYGRADLGRDMQEALYRATSGNPLTILETLRVLESEGAMVREGEHWLAVGGAAAVPSTPGADGLVSRRLAAIAPEDRTFLEAAAVAGEEFDPEIVAELAGVPRMRVPPVLQSLELRHRLIEPTLGGFRFDHPRLREVLYEEIDPVRRREAHATLARQLESRSSGRGSEARTYALAHHYAAAGDAARALPYLRAAAEAAKRLFAHRDAASYYARAVEALESSAAPAPLSDAPHLYLELGRAYALLGEWEPAVRALRRAGDLDTGAARGTVAAEALTELGLIATRRGRWDDALRELIAARESFHQLDARGEEGRTWRLIGNVYFELGTWDRVNEHYEEALRLAEEIGDRGLAGNVLNNLGAVSNARGDRDRAVQFYRRALENFALAGDRVGEARAYHNLGLTFTQMKNWAFARSYLARSLANSRAARETGLAAMTRITLGEVALAENDLALAREEVLAALEIFRRLDDPLGEADARRILGAIFEAEERYEEAEEAIRRSIELNVAGGSRLQESEGRRDLGRVLARQGKAIDAGDEIRRAAEGFRSLGATRELEELEAWAKTLQATSGGS